MSNLSDKELDRLSREAADLYEPDDSSLSWTRLEQKLIGQMPERPPDGFRLGRIKPYVWGTAVIVLSGISFYFIKNTNYSQHSTRTNNSVSQSVISSVPVDSGLTVENEIHLDSLSTAVQRMAPAIQNARSSKQRDVIMDAGTNSAVAMPAGHSGTDTRDRSPKGTKAILPANRATLVAITSKGTIASNRSPVSGRISASIAGSASIVKSSNKAIAEVPADVTGNSGDPATRDITDGQQDQALIQREKTPFRLPLLASSGAGLGQVEANDSLLNHPTRSSGSTIPPRSVHVNRSLNFGLSFGPDYTDGGGIANDQLSNNIGITVGYYLTSRLSLNTGIFYTNKFYWSPGDERHDRTPYPQGGNSSTFAALPQVENVNGSCNMYEIPLTLRFDFAKNEKTKFFVNGGLSSYFMLKQTYIYFFHSGGRPLAWKQSDNQQVNYWFGVGDLSFGLETDMGKGFSFQAEPFLRIPLREMGLQNLKLNSYGFLLSFRYAPVLSRTKK